MSPTIVVKDGKTWLVTGSPGGSRIITTVLQMVVNSIDLWDERCRSDQRTALPPSVAAGRAAR
jgi:gamma-glutamyltranspeptidase